MIKLKKLNHIHILTCVMLFTSVNVFCQTVDLNTHVSGAPPTGLVLGWHNATPVSAANLMSAAQVAVAPVGVYYAVFYDAVNDCYSPESKVAVVTNSCPETIVDLNSHVSSSAPSGSVLEWHNALPLSVSNLMSASAVASVSAGSYYVTFYDNINDCYSPYSLVIATTSACVDPCDATASGNTDTDGDNVSDICDLDDDNDGILDSIECPVTLLDILIETSIITRTSNQTLTGTGGEVLNITLSSPTIAYNTQLYYGGIFGYWLSDNNPVDEQITFNFDKPITDIIIYATAHSNVTLGSEEMLLDVNGVQHTFNPTNFNVTLENPQISVDGLRILGSTITGDGSFNYTITNPSGITSITLHHNVITGDPEGSIYDVRVSGNILSSSPDTDGDGMPDCLDLDSDNDGCSDADETYGVLGTDSNGDGTYGGIVGSSGVDTDGKVIGASYATPATITGGEYTFQQGMSVSITTPPVNETTCSGSDAEFTAVATTTRLTTNPATTASTDVNYQWQVRTNGGTTFTNISGESGTVTSGAEVSLSLTGITIGMDNNIYKVVFTNEANICGVEAEASLNVIDEADLELTKTVNNPTPSVGSTIIFTVTVTNQEPCDATGITVQDELPAGLIYVSNTTTAGTYNYNSTSGIGIWDFSSETLNVNDTETLTVTVKIGPACRTISSAAEIMTSSRTDPDSTPGSGD